MKNHIKVNGKLLQTNKKWSHLRQKQKEYISDWLHREYIQFIRTHHRKPRKYVLCKQQFLKNAEKIPEAR
ncbi:hypothetical protein J7E43_22100, partial [Bacillus sp. ISL-8]|nr:hypothetical protein [Bacillus sp. ISL-8]